MRHVQNLMRSFRLSGWRAGNAYCSIGGADSKAILRRIAVAPGRRIAWGGEGVATLRRSGMHNSFIKVLSRGRRALYGTALVESSVAKPFVLNARSGNKLDLFVWTVKHMKNDAAASLHYASLHSIAIKFIFDWKTHKTLLHWYILFGRGFVFLESCVLLRYKLRTKLSYSVP